jgi:hypothetical protein
LGPKRQDAAGIIGSEAKKSEAEAPDAFLAGSTSATSLPGGAIIANATSTVALLPGAAASMAGYGREVASHRE